MLIIMKTTTKILFGLSLLGALSPVWAADRPDLDNRLRTLTTEFQALQQKPDRRIPADYLAKACGIVLLDRTKAGFGFAYQGGSGVLMIKRAEGQWSPPVFLRANQGSFGFQAGGEQNFTVVLLMDTNSIRNFTGPVSELGGAARGTAGNDAAGTHGQVSSPKQYDTLVFNDRTGLYGGAFVENGVISPDLRANALCYNSSESAQDILYDDRTQATPAGRALAESLGQLK